MQAYTLPFLARIPTAAQTHPVFPGIGDETKQLCPMLKALQALLSSEELLGG